MISAFTTAFRKRRKKREKKLKEQRKNKQTILKNNSGVMYHILATRYHPRAPCHHLKTTTKKGPGDSGEMTYEASGEWMRESKKYRGKKEDGNK